MLLSGRFNFRLGGIALPERHVCAAQKQNGYRVRADWIANARRDRAAQRLKSNGDRSPRFVYQSTASVAVAFAPNVAGIGWRRR